MSNRTPFPIANNRNGQSRNRLSAYCKCQKAIDENAKLIELVKKLKCILKLYDSATHEFVIKFSALEKLGLKLPAIDRLNEELINIDFYDDFNVHKFLKENSYE